jgi:hypothetical protein
MPHRRRRPEQEVGQDRARDTNSYLSHFGAMVPTTQGAGLFLLPGGRPDAGLPQDPSGPVPRVVHA